MRISHLEVCGHSLRVLWNSGPLWYTRKHVLFLIMKLWVILPRILWYPWCAASWHCFFFFFSQSFHWWEQEEPKMYWYISNPTGVTFIASWKTQIHNFTLSYAIIGVWQIQSDRKNNHICLPMWLVNSRKCEWVQELWKAQKTHPEDF